ncbi:MAG: 50S ribosomal protein L13 [Candidatus Levybacteria bacterium RIFCSPHIGHO2_02_FULL_39_36]|nr:MAG: 50S ribosomal protein L13 [Candidatus Levybacteria bacterium GW2011_GWB1_39_7]KKR27555.1 MAG: 50S ribosomal protein L13 [Microgenomates group bacterium GW2011_GWC1_39_7]OGH15479.1 MAG: 50S ribosomal protein L13 [Candidatus Levybacteria bacterium RIFCSPHIGHO2_01_FULL_38_96]OGH25613.1 MAG: 50S ribosomal protein L13 [Candidatus Levybacteria bacterium RIFCSPHIGHO2_12_FULL_39_39]OGH28486.1 MAG: 50S ribosomal protein L13 [Candidatus Levybacteria bacterium RIFCSPHIGHO2_02_FULL_39_36]OGH36243.
MQTATQPTKVSQIKRDWHLIDVKGKILGRVSTEIARLLMGKNKPYFVKNLDCGDYVVVINAKEISITGKKEKDKIYTSYSGYPGGLRKRTLAELRHNKPEEIVRHTVSGMLPKNKLRNSLLKKLFVFRGEEHKYEDKFQKVGV